MSQQFKDLIVLMLHVDPKFRPGIADILASDWMGGETANEETVGVEFS